MKWEAVSLLNLTEGKYVGWWGSLGGEVKGVVTYGLSPNRQRAYAGAMGGIKEMLTRRIFGLAPVVAGLLPWYLIYQYMASTEIASQRKNPKDGYIRSRGY